MGERVGGHVNLVGRVVGWREGRLVGCLVGTREGRRVG